MGTSIVEAVNNWDDPEELARIASGSGKGMKGQSNEDMPEEEKLQSRGV
jgi:pyridoxal 5'-phosphate synthase pdxS subunit